LLGGWGLRLAVNSRRARCDARPSALLAARFLRNLSHAFLRLLVVPQPFERWMAQLPIARPLGEGDLGDVSGLHPDRVTRARGASRRGTIHPVLAQHLE